VDLDELGREGRAVRTPGQYAIRIKLVPNNMVEVRSE
jgi:hypothetical protein